MVWCNPKVSTQRGEILEQPRKYRFL